MRKKIGIVTFHRAYNYGAMLQAVALQDYLSQNYDVKIINYKDKIIENRYKLVRWEKMSLKNIIINVGRILLSKKRLKRQSSFKNFFTNNLKITKEYTTEEEIINNYPKFDYYITGSDQVWNPEITNGVSNIYTLNFGDDRIKRISYAASFGIENIDDKYLEDFKEKLKRIDYFSVREKTAVNLLKNITKKKSCEVLDPTLLVTKDYWDKKIKNLNTKAEKEKYILCYQLDTNDEYTKIANYLSKYYGYKIIHFNPINKYYKKVLRSAYTNGPLEFINLIKNAEYVIVTSFHGTVFSTLFHKKFLVIPNKGNGSRMVDFLKKIKLENRIIYKFNDLEKIDFDKEIDFTDADKIIEKEREKSRDFLDMALK